MKIYVTRKIPEVALSVLSPHGNLNVWEHDEVIPGASTRALHQHFGKGVATFAVVSGARHNDISEYPAYIQLLKDVP